MCGIAGFVSDADLELSYLKLMANALIHRGPDEEGFYFEPPAGLAIRRLAIIDVAKGHQPISDEKNRYHIVFNGEIYNYVNLRKDLIRQGHTFLTNSDTETLVHLYEHYGTSCLQYLEGMFAFAIWDKSEHTLFLARDRLGKKPLFYYLDQSGLWFGSELKALKILSNVKKTLNLRSLSDYLSFMYIPAPATIFEEIKKVQPGHFLIYNHKDKTIKETQYWRPIFEPKTRITLPEATAQFRDLFTEAVEKRLLSERPLGAFLSGGIDSSLVVATMSRLTHQPVQTFSIGFENDRYDETRFGSLVAKHCQTNHTELIVKPNIRDLIEKLPLLYDEPYADSSAIPTFFLCQLTRQSVIVALSGDGGDELFGGYRRYLSMMATSKLPASLLNKTTSKVAALLLNKQPDLNTFSGRILRLARASLSDPIDNYGTIISAFSTEQKEKLLSKETIKNIPQIDSNNLLRHILGQEPTLKTPENYMRLDMLTYLPFDLLVKVDIASMAHSLEVRCPFLDHKLVDFVTKLPLSFKLTFFNSKILLKAFAKELLPSQIIKRKKMGFGVPLAHWFRFELREALTDYLLNSKIASDGYLNQDYITNLVKKHFAGTDFSKQIWTLLQLELWYRNTYF